MFVFCNTFVLSPQIKGENWKENQSVINHNSRPSSTPFDDRPKEWVAHSEEPKVIQSKREGKEDGLEGLVGVHADDDAITLRRVAVTQHARDGNLQLSAPLCVLHDGRAHLVAVGDGVWLAEEGEGVLQFRVCDVA